MIGKEGCIAMAVVQQREPLPNTAPLGTEKGLKTQSELQKNVPCPASMVAPSECVLSPPSLLPPAHNEFRCTVKQPSSSTFTRACIVYTLLVHMQPHTMF